MDTFDGAGKFASFEGTDYRTFDNLDVHRSIQWLHADHWMVDIAPDPESNPNFNKAFGAAMLSPNRTFRFEDGKFSVDTDYAATHPEYGPNAWGEIIITTSERPVVHSNAGSEKPRTHFGYGYEMFPNHWTLGCRFQPDAHTICALMNDSRKGSIDGGRDWEMSFFQHVGETSSGGFTDGTYYRYCEVGEPDTACRDRFRLELTKTSLTIYANGVEYFKQTGIPPLPDEFVNADLYVYLSSNIYEHTADAVRFHWDEFAVNNPAPPSAAPGFHSPGTEPATPTPVSTIAPTATPVDPTSTVTPADPTPTVTPGDPGPTATPEKPLPTATPGRPVPTATPGRPVPTATPVEPAPTATTAPSCWPMGLPAGAISGQPDAVFCDINNSGTDTHGSGENSWMDTFDGAGKFASFEGTNYRTFDNLDVHRSIHWLHGDHWMVDIAPDSEDNANVNQTVGAAMLSPNRTFRFEDGKFSVDTDYAATHPDYGVNAWGEIIITAGDHPVSKSNPNGETPRGILYGYDMFPTNWTLGCRFQLDANPICSFMRPNGKDSIDGGREWEMSSFQHVGTTVSGGYSDGTYFRFCQPGQSDIKCRDRFRLELTRTSLTIYANGVEYFKQSGMPPFPDEFINADLYVYLSSNIYQHKADTVRFHWDELAVNNPAPPSAAPGFSAVRALDDQAGFNFQLYLPLSIDNTSNAVIQD